MSNKDITNDQKKEKRKLKFQNNRTMTQEKKKETQNFIIIYNTTYNARKLNDNKCKEAKK